MDVETTYRVRVKEGTIRHDTNGESLGGVAFMAGGEAVELDNDGDVFETTDRRAYEAIRVLPFLEDLGETSTPKGATVTDVVATLGNLADSDLAALRESDTRKGVHTAIDAELARRAAGEGPNPGVGPSDGGEGGER